MFQAIIEDDELDASEFASLERTRWGQYESAALRQLGEEQEAFEESLLVRKKRGQSSDRAPSSTSSSSSSTSSSRIPLPSLPLLHRYGIAEHLRVAARAALESLVILPFWAIKMSIVCRRSRVPGILSSDSPKGFLFPSGPSGSIFLTIPALKALIAAEGPWRGLFKGAIPMVTLGVGRAMIDAMQRHIRFVRSVELGREGASYYDPVGRSSSSSSPTSSSKLATRREQDAAGTVQKDTGMPNSLASGGAKVLGRSEKPPLPRRQGSFSSFGSFGSFPSFPALRSISSGTWGSYGDSMADLRSDMYRGAAFGGAGGGDASGAATGLWGVVWTTAGVFIQHPFELLGLRLVTSSRPHYRSLGAALWHHVSFSSILWNHVTSFWELFVGVRQSLFNCLVLPNLMLGLPTTLLLGVPALLRTRRMLDRPISASVAAVGGGGGGGGGAGGTSPVHGGLGGSVQLCEDIIKQEGWSSLLAGARATLDIALPCACSILLVRAVSWAIFGDNPEGHIRTAIRRQYLLESFQRRRAKRSKSDGAKTKSSSNSARFKNRSTRSADVVGSKQQALEPKKDDAASLGGSGTAAMPTRRLETVSSGLGSLAMEEPPFTGEESDLESKGLTF